MEPLAWYRIAAPVAFVVGLSLLSAIRPTPRFRAMLLGIGVLSGYAMVQDQVSVRLCPEYFTVFHNPIPGLTDPTLLGIAWGFLGAWWGGALLGYFAGLAATVGNRPPLAVRELVRPMLFLVASVGFVSALTGFTVTLHADKLGLQLDPSVDAVVPPHRQPALFAVACYHLAGYATAIAGSVVLCIGIARERRSRAGA